MTGAREERGYMKWIEHFPLRPITGREENEKALTILSELIKLSNRGRLTADEGGYLHVLSMLIEEFEKKTYDLGPYLTQGEMLEELMKEHGLRQVDLEAEMGSQSAVSHVVNGKRKLTVEQIEALSRRFHVSPAVFFKFEAPIKVTGVSKRTSVPRTGKVRKKR